jgi:hypothetical protein
VRPFIAFALLATACSAEFAVPAPDLPGAPSVSVEPRGSLAAAPAVFRLRVAGGAKRSALSDYRFFSGELSSYHLGRIRNRALPSTLLEREISVLTWAEGSDVVVAPLQALESGSYALATPEIGLVAELTVDRSLAPILERVWPPKEASRGGGVAVFCGEAAAGALAGPVELEPASVRASVLHGLDAGGMFSERCVCVELLEPVTEGVPLLPPAFVGDLALEPRLLVASNDTPEPSSCGEPSIELGPVCGVVDDDRIELHSSGEPALVAFETPVPLLGVVDSGSSLVLRGFEPATSARVKGLVLDVRGERSSLDVEIQTAPARPHLVLNEVLANPLGVETSGEWIELVNDGSDAARLDGFVLDDAIELVPLPAHELDPAQMVLLVAESYAPDPELDLVPPDDLVILRVPRLGKNGLTNTGELLRLRDGDGNVVSRFPALRAPAPGRSVARRTPDAPDGTSRSFGDHAAPGASPGGPNVVEELAVEN